MRVSLKQRLANLKAAEAAAATTQPAAKTAKRQRPIVAELQSVVQQDNTALQTVEQATLLPLDAPVVDPSQPCRSYKVAQKASGHWIVSDDGGKTNTDTGVAVIGGRPVDLTLEITPANRPAGNYTHDYRLRLAFFDHDGVLSEINLNAVTIRDGVPCASTTARTLIASLAVISQSEDDMLAFIDQCRFSLESGTAAAFITVSIANGESWTPINGKAAFKSTPLDPTAFLQLISSIKSRFRGVDLLSPSPAINGDSPLLSLPAAEECIDVDACEA